ncbi:purine-nucleoside phosphorylase [Desulfatiferula olefinivorans]
MSRQTDHVAEACSYLQERLEHTPDLLILAGTGLGDCAGILNSPRIVPYASIPHFPRSTVESHAGQLSVGSVHHVSAAVMMGRFHLYEGYSPAQVTFPIRVMRALGVRVLIVTNAAGGLDPAFAPGDIMVIRDHINLTGDNPLVGPNVDAWGLRFPDMIGAYDPTLADLARRAVCSPGLTVHDGVYAGLKGPSLETPAEMRFLRLIGAQAVGFSTVQEVIAARHAGMRTLGLSVITNRCDPDRPEPATVEGVIAVARQAAPQLENLIETVAASMGDMR